MASGFYEPVKDNRAYLRTYVLSGRFVALASIIIAPIIVNIFLFTFYLSPEGTWFAIFLVTANSFLAYSNWDKV